MSIQSRRLFITQTALATLGLAFLPQCKKHTEEDEPSHENKQSIIVIGAGIAGLAAANKLKKAGHQVSILEASMRYGGRIQTTDIDGYKADFGASWIHGINGNPLYSLANSNNIITKQTHYEPSYIFDINGDEITYADWSIIEDLFVQLYDLATENQNSSIQDLLDIMHPNLNLSEKLSRLWYGAVRSEYEIPYAVDASDISAKAIIGSDSFPGEDVIFPNGMQSLCDILAADLEIEYNAFVSKVSYETEQVKVFINKADDVNVKRSCMACHSGGEAELLTSTDIRTADRVIIALPLGMLKNKGISFNPALSNEKLAAIDSIGIGTMNKVFLKFNENFWYKNAYFLEHLQEDSSQIIEFFSPAPTGTPNILVAVLSGQQARSIEHMDNAQVKDLVINELKAMFGEDIPEPIAMKKTTWHTHPFALGSYPHLKPGSDISACDIIAAPLNNKVFFAGDATSKKYMSTAHGAYLSGISAAESIIE